MKEKKPKKNLRLVLYITRDQWRAAEVAAVKNGLTTPQNFARMLLLKAVNTP